MNLDTGTAVAVAALLVNIGCGVFVIDAAVRRDDLNGRLWSLGFLNLMFATLAMLTASIESTASWAVLVGEAASVAGIGCLWLALVRHNLHAMRVPLTVVLVVVAPAVVAAALAAIAPSWWTVAWVGAVWMQLAVSVVAVGAALECARGGTRLARTAWAFGIALLGIAGWSAVRAVVVGLEGPSAVPATVTAPDAVSAALGAVFVVIALMTASVLRVEPVPGAAGASSGLETADGVLPMDAFLSALAVVASRARERGDLLTVVACRAEDVDTIATAFGSEVAGRVTTVLRSGVRRHAPATALVGCDGPSALLVATVSEDAADARRRAARIYRGALGDLGDAAGGVVPTIGIGVALADTHGYDAGPLIAAAHQGAVLAASTAGSSVVLSGES